MAMAGDPPMYPVNGTSWTYTYNDMPWNEISTGTTTGDIVGATSPTTFYCGDCYQWYPFGYFHNCCCRHYFWNTPLIQKTPFLCPKCKGEKEVGKKEKKPCGVCSATGLVWG